MSTLYPEYIDAGITKWKLRPRKIEGDKYIKTININDLSFGLKPKLSMYEQSKYKYIVNIDGHVSAFRLSQELNLGSVILLVNSDWKIWYSHMLKPFVHYIPIKNDLSDLISTIKWCRNNDNKCKEIVINANLFYKKYLSKKGILDFMQMTLVDYEKNNGKL